MQDSKGVNVVDAAAYLCEHVDDVALLELCALRVLDELRCVKENKSVVVQL